MSETNLVHLDVGRVVAGWKIEKKLGEGAFGAVYKCSKNDLHFALKVESELEKVQLLKMEVIVLMQLGKSRETDRHFCKIEDRGHCDKFNYVVMTLVGKSLQDLRFDMPNRKLSMGTALSIGIQCLEALEDLHSVGYLHRDVKPGNYTIGRPELKELRKIYVLDFGMARKFVHDDGTMKKPRSAAGFRGTVRYAALSCHIQRELCRKDDIESWLYMLIELTRGYLPWRNIEEQDDVGIFKKDCRKDAKCIKALFGGCPKLYVEMLKYADSLKFFDQPDYPKIYKWLRDAITTTKSTEFPYDWEPEAIKAREEKEKKKAAKPDKKTHSDTDKEQSEKKKKNDDDGESEKQKKASEKEKANVVAAAAKKSAENASEAKKKRKPGQPAVDKASPFVSPAVSPLNIHNIKEETPDVSAKKQKKKMVIQVPKNNDEDGPSEKNKKKSAEKDDNKK